MTSPMNRRERSSARTVWALVLVDIALPLLASLVVGATLLRPSPGRAARVIARGATCLIGLLTMLAMLTVGPALLPVVGCLAIACAVDSGRPPSVSAGAAAAD